MSRTYRKYLKCFFATGSNTEWYRSRNHINRVKNKHQLVDLMAKNDPESVDEKFTYVRIPKRDSWREPTDGHFLYTKDYLKRQIEIDEDIDFWVRGLRKLKPKRKRQR